MSRHELRMDYRRLHPDVYLRKGAVFDAQTRMRAAAYWGGDDAVLVGFSALVMHGAEWFTHEPAEVARRGITRAPVGIIARQYDLWPEEVDWIDGVQVTSAVRTGYDLARLLGVGRAVAAVDSLCRVTGLDTAAIIALGADHPGARGSRRLREVLDFVDPGAESPQETATRLLLVAAGFPRPATQIPVLRRDGSFVARLDMGWPEWKVAVEYDGAQHWTDSGQYARDIDRHAELAAMGWAVIRASAAHLRSRRLTLLTRTAAALRAAGAPIPDENALRQANVAGSPRMHWRR
ncbi:endonuclease domain-containing protein [Nocardia heshunensis]